MMVGAAIGAIIASKLSSGIGRKKSLMIGAALFIVGCLGSGMATSVEMLIGARLILGLSVGIASYTAPLYLAEMSDKDARGSIISGYQLMVTVGILVAFLSDTYFSYTGDWREGRCSKRKVDLGKEKEKEKRGEKYCYYYAHGHCYSSSSTYFMCISIA